MIKEICKDQFLLSRKCRDATKDDIGIAKDLIDTLLAYDDLCVGMGANMIGQSVRIIAFYNQETNKIEFLFNPEIIMKSGKYIAEEGCLSLKGTRETERYKNIKVKFQDENGTVKYKTYKGFTAQIVQHEIDHTNGILI